MLRPLVLANVADAAPHQSPESLLFPARSTEYLPRCHRKRCAPNREEPLLQPGKRESQPRIRTAGRPNRLYIVFGPPMPATNIVKSWKALAERAKDGSHWSWHGWQYATARVDGLLRRHYGDQGERSVF